MDPPTTIGLAVAEAAVASARRAYVERNAYDADGNTIHPMLLEESRRRERATQRFAEDADNFMPGFRAHFDLVLAAVAAGRAELIRLHREGLIEDEVLHDLERDLDLEETGALYQRGE
jgi:CPA1 family monovalent cation:H+ antiporter